MMRDRDTGSLWSIGVRTSSSYPYFTQEYPISIRQSEISAPDGNGGFDERKLRAVGEARIKELGILVGVCQVILSRKTEREGKFRRIEPYVVIFNGDLGVKPHTQTMGAGMDSWYKDEGLGVRRGPNGRVAWLDGQILHP